MNIEKRLGSLRTEAPEGFADRVLARVAHRFTTVDSPLGPLVVVFGDRGVVSIGLEEERDRVLDDMERRVGARPMPGDPPQLMQRRLARAIADGRPGDLDVDLSSLTEFQRAVLEKTAEIPAGQVRPYGWIAREIGRPGAVRAVGTALASNPVPVVIPCHRVVRADGAFGEYSLGETANKQRLLAHEGLDVEAYEDRRTRGVRFSGSRTTKIFCLPTCHHTKRTKPENLTEFGSVGGAERAGYRPCRTCRPAVLAS